MSSSSANDDTESDASNGDNDDTKELSYAELKIRILGILKRLDLKKEDLKNEHPGHPGLVSK